QHGVGIARARFCRDGSAPRLVAIERRVPLAHVPPLSDLGARVAAAVAPWQEKVKAEAEVKIATLPRPCPAQGLNGTALGEQVARSIAERAADAAPPPKGVPVVGVTNAGGLRAPLPAGTLRFTDLFTAFPFE